MGPCVPSVEWKWVGGFSSLPSVQLAEPQSQACHPMAVQSALIHQQIQGPRSRNFQSGEEGGGGSKTIPFTNNLWRQQ